MRPVPLRPRALHASHRGGSHQPPRLLALSGPMSSTRLRALHRFGPSRHQDFRFLRLNGSSTPGLLFATTTSADFPRHFLHGICESGMKLKVIGYLRFAPIPPVRTRWLPTVGYAASTLRAVSEKPFRRRVHGTTAAFTSTTNAWREAPLVNSRGAHNAWPPERQTE